MIGKINTDNHTKEINTACRVGPQGRFAAPLQLQRRQLGRGGNGAPAKLRALERRTTPRAAIGGRQGARLIAPSTLRAPILGGHAARATRRPSARRPPARPRRANGRRLGQPACRAEASDATAQPQTYAVPGNVRLGELHTSPSSELATSDAPDDGRSTPASVVQAVARLGPRRRRAANGQVHARALQRPRRPLATSPSIVGHSTPGLADNMRRRASAHPVVGARGGHCPDHPYERALLRSSVASSIACTTRTPTRPVRAESARRVPHICLRDRRDPGRTDRTRPSSRGFSGGPLRTGRKLRARATWARAMMRTTQRVPRAI